VPDSSASCNFQSPVFSTRRSPGGIPGGRAPARRRDVIDHVTANKPHNRAAADGIAARRIIAITPDGRTDGADDDMREATREPACSPEMDMDWVHPWVGLNEKYRGIVAEYCKTQTFHYP